MTWLAEHPRKAALSAALVLVLATALIGVGRTLGGTSTASDSAAADARVTQQLRLARASAAKERTARERNEASLMEMTGRARRWTARAQRVEERLDAAKTRARKRIRNDRRG